jgi:fatty acid kinase/fatty acid kinase fatty acid binding subunit
MELTKIDKPLFFHSIRYACLYLAEARESINAINVFPVADGDTGDNMAATAKAIIFHSHEADTLAETARTIADASVMGARGNSGMIFSQFFNGIAENIPNTNALTTLQFAQLIQKAVASVRTAIFNPVEGTILTVMEQWSQCLLVHSQSVHCFRALNQACLPMLEKALQSTQTTLDVLREAHVVDAGALGFSMFIQGTAAYIDDPSLVIQEETVETIAVEHEIPTADQKPNKRYCTEAVLMSSQLNKANLSETLSSHGESIVMSSNPRLSRFHIHCDKPWDLFADLQAIGTIQYPKVDDMIRQYQSMHQRKHPIALVTDSSANLSDALMERYQVHTIPVNVHINEHDLLDKLCLDTEQG